MCGVLGVELPEEVYIPWSLVVEFAVPTDVDEVVGVVAKYSPDGEWSLPRRGELVHALLVLDEAQHQVAFLEGASPHPPAVVAAESLLVYGGARPSEVTCLV